LAIQLRGRVCERWRSFANFYADVGKCPSWRHLLMRTDTSAEFSPDNCRWQPMVHIGLYANEADYWRIHLGWPDQGEIDSAKSKGLVVLPLTVTYEPTKRP
jgi:hypothetical protein